MAFNPCAKRRSCKIDFICEVCRRPHKQHCPTCGECHRYCPDFQEEFCPKLSKPPYCCNGCGTRKGCTLRKWVYNAKNAQDDYENLRSESRKGVDITPEELHRIDAFVSPRIKQGQSIRHILENNRDVLMVSERTLYNYQGMGLLSATHFDMPRKIRMRPRKKKTEPKVDRHCYEGRTYQDFLAFLHDNPDVPVVEMDSVIGHKGGKVSLTVFLRNCNLLLAFLRDDNSARSVKDIIDSLYACLGPTVFCNIFPTILTDRGSEFSDPTALEYDREGHQRCLVFYCDPSSPHQKGGIEVCHEMVRRILPKGTSFDNLQQSDIDLMCSHINSYTREKLNNRSAYQVFSFLYGGEVLPLLNIREIPESDICLTPKLLQKQA